MRDPSRAGTRPPPRAGALDRRHLDRDDLLQGEAPPDLRPPSPDEDVGVAELRDRRVQRVAARSRSRPSRATSGRGHGGSLTSWGTPRSSCEAGAPAPAAMLPHRAVAESDDRDVARRDRRRRPWPSSPRSPRWSASCWSRFPGSRKQVRSSLGARAPGGRSWSRTVGRLDRQPTTTRPAWGSLYAATPGASRRRTEYVGLRSCGRPVELDAPRPIDGPSGSRSAKAPSHPRRVRADHRRRGW